MDTLLYVGQIVAGATLLAAALALASRNRARLGASDTSVTMFADFEVTRANCLFGALLAVAAIAFGVTGLAGASVLPAPVGVLVTGFGLISVLLGTETTPASYRVTLDAVTVIPVPRASAEILTIPSRVPPERVSREAA